jgi:predicted DNA-binding transcriptional regulator YafY
MARWLLMFGSHAEIESPEELKKQVGRLVEELREHHGVQFENLKI